MEDRILQNIYVNIKTRTSKNENKLFLVILENLKNRDNETEKNEIDIEIINLKLNYEEIIEALNGLMSKRIEVFYAENDNSENRLVFPYISGYNLQKEKIKIFLPQCVANCFKKNTFEYNISLKTFFYLRNKSNIIFFNSLIKNIEQNKNIEINLEELKNMLDISENSYERFFDFEKNFLKPLVEKINKYSNFIIEYNKIKKGENKNNKVIGIKFSIKNIEIAKCKGETIYLTQIIKNLITDYSSIQQAVNQSIIKYSFEETKRNILFLKENGLKISDEEIKNYLKNNGRNVEEILKLTNHILIKEKYGLYKDVNVFIKNIYDIIIGYDFYYSLNFKFLNTIKNYKENENFYYRDSSHVIFGNYSQNKGYFKIFEAKEKI